MGDLFLKTLNMSIAASWLILAVVLLRLVLKKAPRWIAVLLWGIVAVRLVVPFSIESALSLIPSAETFSAHNIRYETPAISSGIPAVNKAVNPILGEAFAPNPAGSVNPLYGWTLVVSVIWIVGVAAMLLYAVISYARVRRSVAERVPYEENIFLCDHVKSPFILGLVRPKIYLPSSMDAAAMEPVIAHEKAHLTRRDHWWKPLGFLILTVHWFNPLCWVAYVLLCRDIELACDEKVIRQMDLDGKKQYSAALLECSTGRRLVTVCPLAFGEVGVKERVKNVLHYKKPAFWVVVAAVVACAVVTVCFATNPKQDLSQERRTVQARITEVEDGSFLVAPVEGASELSSSDLFRVPIMNMPPSPEPRVGDVIEIIYDGSILESYPAQFGTIYSMRVVSREDSLKIDELRAKYPEYFELGTFKGLEVYVWQMAENSYRFGLMQGTNREKTLEEKLALKGATAEEMALILSTFDIEDKNIFVIPWQNPISSYMVTEDMVRDPGYIDNIRAMLGLDGGSMGSTGIDGITSLDKAISQAVLDHYASDKPDGLIHVESHVLLANEGTKSDDTASEETAYLLVLHQTYSTYSGVLEEKGGSYIPAAITFHVGELGGYTVKEYWEPRDGTYYASDIRSKFPGTSADDALHSQAYIEDLEAQCYQQALAYLSNTGSLDTKIAALLDVICSSPATASAPGAYISAHETEYGELLGYGEYTLRYCFTEFLKGGQTGLRGHIMRAAMDDIAPEAQLNSGAETGQEYFDAWKDAAVSVGKQHDMEWIEKYQPAIYLLLSMLGEA